MIADLIHDKLKIRLITRNVMSVYSTNYKYTDEFLRTLKPVSYTHLHLQDLALGLLLLNLK